MKSTAKFPLTTPSSKTLGEPWPSRSAALTLESLIDSPAYVLYLSDRAFEPSYVSQNSKDLLGIPAEHFIGDGSIWKKIIPDCDQGKVFETFKELDRAPEVSCVHRIFNCCGVATWVLHEVRVVKNGGGVLRGCIAPLAGNDLSRMFEPSTISEFIHKLGNHFQLLQLAFDSIPKGGTNAHDVDVIQETLNKAIAMTCAFSEYTQEPACVPAFDFLEVIAAVTKSQRSAIDSQVEIHCDYDPDLSGLSMAGDPYLLELAVRSIIQNSVEAIHERGKIDIRASRHSPSGVLNQVELVVIDDGAGISPDNLPKVMRPFFSTKANHIGLGLNMSLRFVKMHGGTLKIKSAVGKGTEVVILLPVKRNIHDDCR
jgi:Histidine kinase-, DNA gyrase B-, and HSP90-like ATPase